jgi:hypothetical protein
MLEPMRFRWATIFLDIPNNAFEPGVTFWREVTGSGLSPLRGASAEFATLLPATGDAYLRVQRVGAGGGCHLDLHVDVRSEPLPAAAARAEAAGATVRHAADGLIVADSPGGFCLDIPAAGFDRECACADRQALARAHTAAGARVLAGFPHWIMLADPTGREYCLTARDPRTGTLPAAPLS